MIQSDKKAVSRLVKIAYELGVREIVFSPGSRNAPLVISFVESGMFRCLCIPDERTAAFFAMGMAIQSGRTVAICCTSGSAPLNYAPAISESYYQGVPLLVLTADRPVEWIDQGVGQSIRQNNLYANYIKKSFQFIQEASNSEDILHNDRISAEAVRLTQSGFKGPVHINIPLAEPLYRTVSNDEKVEIPSEIKAPAFNPDFERLKAEWQSCSRKLLLMGMSKPDPELNSLLRFWHNTGQVVVLTETSSNSYIDGAIQNIDRLITGFENDAESFRPDLLISIGDAVISKKIKAMFLKNKPEKHWYISEDAKKDTYRALTDYIPMCALDFLTHFKSLESANDEEYQSHWIDYNHEIKPRHEQFVKQCSWSDLKLFSILNNAIPDNSVLHMGNSTVVRYFQLCNQRVDLEYYSNRGVSGIDGCSSTAMGFSYLSDKKNILVTGDIAFFYDSNAFWHNHHPEYLRIILVNNQGGSIFRIIPGPSSTGQLETYFEAKQDMNAEYLCKQHGIAYERAEDEQDFRDKLQHFFDNDCRVKLLEVTTPRTENDRILSKYFSFLHQI